MSGPNPIDAPLLLGVRPGVGLGSAQSRSHIAPLTGGSINLLIYFISFNVTLSSEGKPP